MTPLSRTLTLQLLLLVTVLILAVGIICYWRNSSTAELEALIDARLGVHLKRLNSEIKELKRRQRELELGAGIVLSPSENEVDRVEHNRKKSDTASVSTITKRTISLMQLYTRLKNEGAMAISPPLIPELTVNVAPNDLISKEIMNTGLWVGVRHDDNHEEIHR